MLKWVFGGGKAKEKPNADLPTYEEAREISASGSAAERKRLASMAQLQPEFLYFFATDESPEVRRAVANNESTPIQADLVLARDPDEYVKKDLCGKVGRLLPSLSADQHRKVAEMAFEVVETLSKDGTPGVRAMISEQIRELDNVPPRIVQRLARDAEAIVAAPVLEYSPLLSDADLVDIILAGTRGAALAAIGRRSDLGDQVGSEIVKTGDDQGVNALISNASASLSDDTMNAIVELAEDRPNWQHALAGRSDLSVDLVRKMGRYISNNVLDRLIENNVLVDANIEGELREKVEKRVSGIENNDEVDAPGEIPDEDQLRAESLYLSGGLNQKILLAAALNGEKEFIVHALSRLAESDVTSIRKLLSAKDPKLAISIAWKCGLGMRFATTLQASIMQIPASNLIEVSESDSTYPMSDADMQWSLQVAGVT